ncbi:type I-E CRISPR-associated endoribonuclease Cas2e [Apilactobacillus xinyiensis]|uniref:type I-E CRISPR-associated endoribonuclease Cas2e n=1 Tax=Apilactobacillus xinyiensis TaxID=2841032 RepID=UPI001C7DC08B|nr:type I-E CRISPR-associated endoribonuclease Cas2e [Apilactobacillus xinyiensis]
MPMTVVTLTKVPPSLRGDLTKWMQEIATGVYVGNVNSRVRDKLWSRITENVKQGQATISYHTNTELGYNCETYHTYRNIIDCEGIPLVQIPNAENQKTIINSGFSKAAKFRKIKNINKSKSKDKNKVNLPEYVVFDVETDGLDTNSDNIIEVGAIKVSHDDQKEFDYLVQHAGSIPNSIQKLTGIDDTMISKNGYDISFVLKQFVEFIGNDTLVGYNVNFDIDFINNKLLSLKLDPIQNKYIDVLPLVKHDNMFMSSYKLKDVVLSYGINVKTFHRALSDAESTLKLSTKVNEFANKLKLKR